MGPGFFICEMLSLSLKSQRILGWRDKWENLCDVLAIWPDTTHARCYCWQLFKCFLVCYVLYTSLPLCLFLFHTTDYNKDKRIIISVSRKYFEKLFSGGRSDDHSTGLPEVPPRTWAFLASVRWSWKQRATAGLSRAQSTEPGAGVISTREGASPRGHIGKEFTKTSLSTTTHKSV